MHFKSKKFHTVKLMGQEIIFNKGEQFIQKVL